MPTAAPNRDIFLTLAAVGLWSTVATAFKLGLSLFSPLQLVTLSVTVATLFFLALSLATGRLDTLRLEKLSHSGAVKRSMGLGLLNPLLYYLILFVAYDLLPAQIAQPVNYTWSITLALLAVPVLGQRLTRNHLLAILLSYSGVLVIVIPATSTAENSSTAISWFGMALALFSTLIWAWYWLLNARDSGEPITMMTISFLTATPILLVTCYFIDGWPAITGQVLAYVVWVGLAEMGLGFMFWQLALRATERVALLGQLIFLAPFMSLLLIHHVLGEAVAASSVTGLGIIVAGLVWSARLPAASKLPASAARKHP